MRPEQTKEFMHDLKLSQRSNSSELSVYFAPKVPFSSVEYAVLAMDEYIIASLEKKGIARQESFSKLLWTEWIAIASTTAAPMTKIGKQLPLFVNECFSSDGMIVFVGLHKMQPCLL